MSSTTRLRLLVVLNILTLSGLVYCLVMLNQRAENVPTETAAHKGHPTDSLLPTQYTVPITGYRDHVGTDSDRAGNTWPKFGDSLKVRKGDPIIYVTYFAWEPNVERWSMDDLRPEFSGGTRSPWATPDPDSLKYRKSMDLWDNGSICIFTERTDTMDMGGQRIKPVRFFPEIRIPYRGGLTAMADTIEFFVVD